MLYNVKWMEKKGADWIVASLSEIATPPMSAGTVAEYTDVSINRIDKKTGAVAFPTFDEIQAGRDIEGELWKSPAGKYYLFAPRAPKQPSNGAYKQKMIDDTMTRKEGSIEKFQGNKEESIRLASSQRDAVLIVTTILQNGADSRFFGDETFLKNEIIKWRNWFLSSDFTDHPPFGV